VVNDEDGRKVLLDVDDRYARQGACESRGRVSEVQGDLTPVSGRSHGSGLTPTSEVGT
jgi:hypothetical protein